MHPMKIMSHQKAEPDVSQALFCGTKQTRNYA